MQTPIEKHRITAAQVAIHEIKKYSSRRPMGHPDYVQALIRLEDEYDLRDPNAGLICLNKIRETQIAMAKVIEQSYMKDPNKSELYVILTTCREMLNREIQRNGSTPFFKPKPTENQSKNINEKPQDEATSQSTYGRSF